MADAKAAEGEIIGHELQVILDEQGVTDKRAQELVEAFGGPFNEVGEILTTYQEIKVTDVNQVEDMKLAREKRLALKNARTTVERKRKELKEDSLKTGRAIDAVARFVKETIEPAEKYLEEQERFAILVAEKERAERTAARIAAITKVNGDPALYNLEAMDEDAFQQLLIKLEKEEADRVAAERAALEQQEAERKAEAERQAAIAAENERLRKEAEEREARDRRKMDRVNQVTQMGMAWDAEQSAYVAADQSITATEILELNEVKWKIVVDKVSTVLEAARAEAEKKRQEQEAARQAEIEKERAAAEAERKKREELEKAEADRRAAEEKAAAEKAAAEHAAAVAPDKEKIETVRKKIESLKLDLPAIKDPSAQTIMNNVYDMLEKVESYIETNVEKL